MEERDLQSIVRIRPRRLRDGGVPCTPRAHRPGTRLRDRYFAVLFLVAATIPFLVPIAAGFGHVGHHLSERLTEQIQVELRAQRSEWEARRLRSFEHAHGPGGERHSHSILIDVALMAVAEDAPEEGERPRFVEHYVDKYVSPAEPDLTPAILLSVAAPRPPIQAGPGDAIAPDVPPPRG